MFGKSNMQSRLKAMDSMMEEGPALKKKPAPGEESQEGFESMLVSPEEKQMILDMRAKEEGAEGSEEEQKEQASPFGKE